MPSERTMSAESSVGTLPDPDTQIEVFLDIDPPFGRLERDPHLWILLHELRDQWRHQELSDNGRTTHANHSRRCRPRARDPLVGSLRLRDHLHAVAVKLHADIGYREMSRRTLY
jgi:hypothetical protein